MVETNVSDGKGKSTTTPATCHLPPATTTNANAEKIVKLQKKIADLSSDCPTNVKDPTFSRWGTISAVAKVVLKHWIPLLFMAKNMCAVDKYKEKNKYLNIVATKLVELMTSKADPEQDSPMHYTSLRWIVAFGDSFYDANMEWVKRHDPVFGLGSYGHTVWCQSISL